MGVNQVSTASNPPAITTQYGPRPDSEFTTGTLFIKTRNSNNQETIAYYQHNHLHTPMQATDKAGNVVWAASYDAFGKATVITPAATQDRPSIDSNLRFPGQYEDGETGLHYNWNRFYEPSSGRYVQPEPIGLAGSINWYGYANGNPLYYLDLDGRVPVVAPLLVVAVGVAVAIIVQSRQRPISTPTPPIPVSNPGNPSGDCSTSYHRHLQDCVDQLCHQLPKKCEIGETCSLMALKEAHFTACANARKQINNECFRGGDRAHQIEYTRSRQQAARCQSTMPTCCQL